MQTSHSRRLNVLFLIGASALGSWSGCSQSKDKKPDSGVPASTARDTSSSSSSASEVTQTEQPAPRETQEKPITTAAPPEKDPPQRVVRPTLPIPKYDEERLKDLGIRRYASRHMVLYTDIDPDLARPLPGLMDHAYAAWEEYFGPLPPDSAGTDFQMIGHIMSDRGLFREAGILTDEIRIHLEGVYRNQVFWMHDQPDDYVRRHLMLHEGTHCYMIAFPNTTNRHIWYMEGMADLFRTHTTDASGTSRFRVFPTDRQNFPGMGRTRVIEEEVQQKGPRRVEDVENLTQRDFLNYDAYSWSWALCAFLDGHPKYRDRFCKIGQMVVGQYDAPLDLRQIFKSDWTELSEEWLVFAGNVRYGYDIERTVLDLSPGKPLPASGAESDIAANRGWQTSGILVEQGKTYRITATGKCVLATVPKPWDSEARGISIRYHAGQPIGKLVATIRSPSLSEKTPYTTMLRVIPIGQDVQFTPEVPGTLYFRVNDFWNELGDNSGIYRVKLSESP
jgi:hypothetical protein